MTTDIAELYAVLVSAGIDEGVAKAASVAALSDDSRTSGAPNGLASLPETAPERQSRTLKELRDSKAFGMKIWLQRLERFRKNIAADNLREGRGDDEEVANFLAMALAHLEQAQHNLAVAVRRAGIAGR